LHDDIGLLAGIQLPQIFLELVIRLLLLLFSPRTTIPDLFLGKQISLAPLSRLVSDLSEQSGPALVLVLLLLDRRRQQVGPKG
jgi:hypothetical protein